MWPHFALCGLCCARMMTRHYSWDSAIYHLLSGYSLSAICYSLSRYLLSAICHLHLYSANAGLPSAICYLLSAICYPLFVICYLLSVICYLHSPSASATQHLLTHSAKRSTIYYLLSAIYIHISVIYHLPSAFSFHIAIRYLAICHHICCFISAICYLLSVICYLLSALQLIG
jgi:hypothetical protein